MSTLPSLVSCWLPTELGEFQLHGATDPATGHEHAALTMGDVANGEPVLTRIQIGRASCRERV